MEIGRTYTENELGEKQRLEEDIKTIFNKDYIPSFLVHKANSLIAKWIQITNWREDNTPPNQEPI